MDLRSTGAIRYYTGCGLFLVLIFTVLEPAGTREAGPAVRWAVWTFQVGILLPLLVGSHMALQRTGRFNRLNPWVQLAWSGACGSMLFLPFGLAVDALFRLDDWPGVTRLRDVVGIVVEEGAGILLPATLTWIAINAPRILRLDFRSLDREPRGEPEPGTHRPSDGPAPNPFLSKVPRDLGRDVVYLKSELHYVRVVTTEGETLVLSNMKDAVAGMEAVTRGIQTHRSYWVACRHIASIRAEGSRRFVRTTDGRNVPVSRRKWAAVKAFLQTGSFPPREN